MHIFLLNYYVFLNKGKPLFYKFYARKSYWFEISIFILRHTVPHVGNYVDDYTYLYPSLKLKDW